MSLYLVDTDWIIQVLHGNADATQTLTDLALHGLAVSLITYGELYQGAYYARDPRAALEALRAILDGVEILPLTATIMERFAIVRGGLTLHQRQQVGDQEIHVAATALGHSLTLVTYNQRDYTLIPSLTLYKP